MLGSGQDEAPRTDHAAGGTVGQRLTLVGRVSVVDVASEAGEAEGGIGVGASGAGEEASESARSA